MHLSPRLHLIPVALAVATLTAAGFTAPLGGCASKPPQAEASNTAAESAPKPQPSPPPSPPPPPSGSGSGSGSAIPAARAQTPGERRPALDKRLDDSLG